MMLHIPAGDDRQLARLEAALTRVIETAAFRRRERSTAETRRRLTRQLRAAFRAQGRAVLSVLNDHAAQLADELAPATESIIRRHLLAEAAAPEYWQQALELVLDDTAEPFIVSIDRAVRSALDHGAREIASQMRISGSFTLDNPAAVGYSEQYAADLVTRINDATRDGINRLVTEAIGDGWSYQQLADSIRETYRGFSEPRPQQHIRDRAELVATTEVGNAYEAGNAGAVQQLQAAGLVMEKSWLTIGDDRVSEDCQSNADAGWIPIDEPFPSGADRPLQHPGCRCTALYRRKPQG